jgi:hypothetical protein
VVGTFDDGIREQISGMNHKTGLFLLKKHNFGLLSTKLHESAKFCFPQKMLRVTQIPHVLAQLTDPRPVQADSPIKESKVYLEYVSATFFFFFSLF